MSSDPNPPENLHTLIKIAAQARWDFRLINHRDQYGCPFIELSLLRKDTRIDATWHTRDAKGYRWWGATIDGKETGASLKKVTQIVSMKENTK